MRRALVVLGCLAGVCALGGVAWVFLSGEARCGAAGADDLTAVTVDELREGVVVVELGRSPHGDEIAYTVRSTDGVARSFRWPDLEIETPDGETVAGWGDDSVLCYPVAAPTASREEEGVPAFGGFTVAPDPGVYTVVYDGDPVGEVRIEG